jgi:hypothetical protein
LLTRGNATVKLVQTLAAPHAAAVRPSSGWSALLLLLMGVLFALSVLLSYAPPAALPADAPAPLFAAGRALPHIEAITVAPRPVGSPANADARAYLLAELARLDIETQVQSTDSTVVSSLPGGVIVTTGDLQNVIGRIRGSGDGAAIALIAHYDSVKTTPGAFDNATGVAALLETARALRAGPQLKNDVIFFFTDAEEVGRLGATASAEAHPWAQDIALALNVDAAGTSGPVVLFQTSAGNSALIGEYAEVAPNPVTSSLLPSVYRLLPNDTDLTPFLRRGVAGMNFAFAANNPGYHADSDTADRLDPRSVQHQGANLLALTRAFGDRDLSALAGEEAIFFTLPGMGVVRYSQAWALPLLLVAALGVLGGLGLGLRRRTLQFGRFVLSALFVIGLGVGLAIVGWLGVQGLEVLRPAGLGVWPGGGVYFAPAYYGGLAVLIGALALLGIGRIQRSLGAANLFAATITLWLALAAASAFLLPGASYIFVWPVLFALPLLLAPAQRGVASTILAALPLAVGVLLLTPVLFFLLLLLHFTAVPALGLGMTLVVGLLADHDLHALRRVRGSVIGVAGVAGASLVAVALLTGFNAERPRVAHLAYSVDADTNTAAWFSINSRPDAWVDQLLGAQAVAAPVRDYATVPALLNVPARAAAAPLAELAAPTIQLLSDATTGAVRTVRLQVTPSRENAEVTMLLEAPAGINAFIVDGAAQALSERPNWILRYALTASAEGETLDVQIPAGSELNVQIAEITTGLPAFAPALPADRMLYETGLPPNGATIVQRRIELNP